MTRARIRPRLSRTFSRARWAEYRYLLTEARASGYELWSLDEWLSEDPPPEARVVILRHDVDQHPRSALKMAAIENELGVRSTWYFRWRTAHPDVIQSLRAGGAAVGLHYETASRHELRRPAEAPGTDDLRSELKDEIRLFASVHGSIRSVAPHGDSRVPQASNAPLLSGEELNEYGIDFDGNDAMRGLAYWLTDRSTAEGGWKDGVSPSDLFADGLTPILCLTHPNNWASGPSLWLDRALSTGILGRRGPAHTSSDAPPW